MKEVEGEAIREKKDERGMYKVKGETIGERK